MILHSSNDGSRANTESVLDELVWVLHCDAEQFQRCGWKIPEIECHDFAGLAKDHGGQNVTVIRVRQCQLRFQTYIVGDKAAVYPMNETIVIYEINERGGEYPRATVRAPPGRHGVQWLSAGTARVDSAFPLIS